jgi:hypothetical protein
MSHWSESAQQAANQDMGNRAPDAPVQDCETRSWEPLAEVEQLPAWEFQAEITAGPDEVTIQTGGAAQPAGDGAASSST